MKMSLSCRVLLRNCNNINSITKPVKWNLRRNLPLRVLSSRNYYENNSFNQPIDVIKRIDTIYVRQYATQFPSEPEKPAQNQEEKNKPGLIQKFKEMYRDYWYVLLPVHVCTSAVWYGSFYYAVRSGVDVIGILESLGVSDSLLEPVKNSGAGYLALAFALYKLATPLRYAVTVGGTTLAINKLTAIGWIKPVPSKERLKEMLQVKRDNLQDRFNESKQHYQVQMKAKGTKVMDEMRRYKEEMRNMKNNKVKKM